MLQPPAKLPHEPFSSIKATSVNTHNSQSEPAYSAPVAQGVRCTDRIDDAHTIMTVDDQRDCFVESMMRAEREPAAAGAQGGAPAVRPRRIIAFPKHGNPYVECLYAEVRSQRIEVIEGIWSTRWLLRNLRRADCLHVHWPSFLYYDADSRRRSWKAIAKFFVLLLYAKLRGASLVWTAHNLFPHDGGGDLFIHRIGRRITTLFADRICVHGAAAAEVVCREFGVPRSRVRVGHHGHWIDYYPNELTREQSRVQLDIQRDEYVYLFVGQCREYKGLETLIETFSGLPGRSRLLIAGKFTSDHYQRQITALAAATRGVELHPQFIPDERLQVYLNAADCVVLPYRTILTSGAAMLAMSFGRPVIAPDLGAMRDHVDAACGILYSTRETSALAVALREIRNLRFEPALIIAHARAFTWAKLAALLTEDPAD